MMTYSQFVEYLEIHKDEYIPDNVDASIRTKKQNNGVLQDGWALMDKESSIDMPLMLYFRDLYGEFSQSNVEINIFLKEKISNLADTVRQKSLDSITDHIFLRIVNAEKNQKMLQDYPCRQISDFIVTYRLLVLQDQEGIGSLLVDHDLAKSTGLSEEQLYQRALKNTEKLFPVKFGNLQDVMVKSQISGHVEVGDEIHVDKNDPLPAYILSNQNCINGATSILYPKVQEELKREFPDGYYVIPSSIHELLLVDNSFVQTPEDLYKLKAGVMEVNYTILNPEEFLSDEIYQVKGPDFKLERANMPKIQREKKVER